MNCVLCKHGQTHPGQATVTLQRGETTVILKGVPAEICENCGEYYLSDDMTGQVLERAEAAVKSGAEVEILRFAA
jgi:YgiT-type zinc finger domain-containing protein